MWIDIHSHQQEFLKEKFFDPCYISLLSDESELLDNKAEPENSNLDSLNNRPELLRNTLKLPNNNSKLSTISNPINQQQKKLTKQMPVYGLHPWHIDQENYPAQLKQIFALIKAKKEPLMGEIGLDKAINTDFSLQETIFHQQIRFADDHGLICLIHCVRAFSEILAFRKKFNSSPPWIIHDFNSSSQMAANFINMNCYLSFGKRIMQGNNRSYRCLKELPDNNRFFLETDAQKDYSIMNIYSAAAQIRQIDVFELKKILVNSFQNCFKEYPCLMNG